MLPELDDDDTVKDTAALLVLIPFLHWSASE
jgi:hypothetical protein